MRSNPEDCHALHVLDAPPRRSVAAGGESRAPPTGPTKSIHARLAGNRRWRVIRARQAGGRQDKHKKSRCDHRPRPVGENLLPAIPFHLHGRS